LGAVDVKAASRRQRLPVDDDLEPAGLAAERTGAELAGRIQSHGEQAIHDSHVAQRLRPEQRSGSRVIPPLEGHVEAASGTKLISIRTSQSN